MKALLGAGLFAISLFGASDALAQGRYVDANSLNCRSEPMASADVVERLARNTWVNVADIEGEWSLLERPTLCWVSSSYLSASMSAYTPPRSSTSARSSSTRSRSGNTSSRRSNTNRSQGLYGSTCPCSGNSVCVGPRGGRYCITSGGNKRYGV